MSEKIKIYVPGVLADLYIGDKLDNYINNREVDIYLESLSEEGVLSGIEKELDVLIETSDEIEIGSMVIVIGDRKLEVDLSETISPH